MSVTVAQSSCNCLVSTPARDSQLDVRIRVQNKISHAFLRCTSQIFSNKTLER